MEGSLLLAINNVRNMIDEVTRTVLSNYVLPEDPIVRFLEYGLKLSERNVKIAHWLATQYKGTPHAIWALEELSEYEDGPNKYYKQVIKFGDIKWQIDEIYVPNDSIVNTANSSSGYISWRAYNYVPQTVASYSIHIDIIFVYSRVVTSVFLQYLCEYLSHVILVNRLNIILEHYILELDPITIIVAQLRKGHVLRRYVEMRVAKKWY
jgi:hypothetical protein